MKYIDLFAGVGGFRYGIDNAMEWLRLSRNKKEQVQVKDEESRTDFSSKNGNRWKQHTLHCVYSNEWDKYANSVYKKHYGECDIRDIRTVKSSEIPEFNLLVGGFPCQSFSVAGCRGGFDDTRGTLFFEIARIAKEKQPRFLLLENVKGLLSHDKGKTFRIILNTLDELGYDVQWQVLNSKNFGVPQNRERVFIIGHLRGTSRPEVFPIGENGKANSKRNEFKLANDIATALTVTNTNDIAIRRLTPVECERLQGFPDNWTKYGINSEISDSQRYKMMGNAVTTNVVTEIIKRLMQFDLLD